MLFIYAKLSAQWRKRVGVAVLQVCKYICPCPLPPDKHDRAHDRSTTTKLGTTNYLQTILANSIETVLIALCVCVFGLGILPKKIMRTTPA